MQFALEGRVLDESDGTACHPYAEPKRQGYQTRQLAKPRRRIRAIRSRHSPVHRQMKDNGRRQ